MDLEFSPGVLETPSLMTPNVMETPLMYRPSPSLLPSDELTADSVVPPPPPPPPPPAETTSTISNFSDDSSSIASSTDKLSEIKNDLKQSLIQSRRPTASPFFSKNTIVQPVRVGPDLPITIPSTAEIVSEIESFDKEPTKETMDSTGGIVSPKKRLIMRSQSRTDCTSPNPTVPSQSQKSLSEEETLLDEIPFQRAPEASAVAVNNKRPIVNEVTSTDPSIGMKRQKVSHAIPTEVPAAMTERDRRQQIRESNRAAARRCRERRRNHIEQLEGTLEQQKLQMKQLNERLLAAERENAHLRAILNEMKMF